MKIAVCIPSRGTIYSQTVEEVLREVKDFDYEIFWSHANPIPDCFNIITDNALADPDVTHLWYVEEDMVLPEGILKNLLNELTTNNWEAVAADYPLVTAPSATIYRDPYGAAYFSGCGCTLMKREIFQYLKHPYWRSDVEWQLDLQQDYLQVTPQWVKDASKVYGYQDITFGILLYTQGHPIMVSEYTCGQRMIEKRGGRDSNQGYHELVEYSDISKKKTFAPEEDGLLVELYVAGDINNRIHVPRERLDEFLKYDKYKRFKYGDLIINDPNGIMEQIR